MRLESAQKLEHFPANLTFAAWLALQSMLLGQPETSQFCAAVGARFAFEVFTESPSWIRFSAERASDSFGRVNYVLMASQRHLRLVHFSWTLGALQPFSSVGEIEVFLEAFFDVGPVVALGTFDFLHLVLFVLLFVVLVAFFITPEEMETSEDVALDGDILVHAQHVCVNFWPTKEHLSAVQTIAFFLQFRLFMNF